MDTRAIRMRSYRSLSDLTLVLLACTILVSHAVVEASSSTYLIGIGSYDITGPAAEVNMMGYANTGQNAAGVHMTLRARAFIVAEPSSSPSDVKRVAFVNLDACMASMAVTLRVLSRLKERYGDLYIAKNVAIAGTHTHSGPGGYLQYVLYLVTSLGFVRQSFAALAYGIELGIVEAHENLRPGSIFLHEGEVLGANINRSPSAYLNNPAEERAKYKYDVDKGMSLLRFVDAEWGPVRAFSWFPVHGTSMNRTNRLISGDNKGAAARFTEDWFRRETNNKTLGEADWIEIAQYRGASQPRSSIPGKSFLRLVGGALHKPSTEQINCHKPKPILIDTGEMFTPYAWAPSVLPIQMLRVGQFIILSVPGEMTTMAGRRLRDAVKMTLLEEGSGQFDANTHIVIAGLAGDYSQYITTFEEYEVQRYEGASTHFGPHTLNGYIQEFKKLATALAQEGEVAAGPPPPNLLDQQYGFLPGVVVDRTPSGVAFGDLKQDVPPNSSFGIGNTVSICSQRDLCIS